MASCVALPRRLGSPNHPGHAEASCFLPWFVVWGNLGNKMWAAAGALPVPGHSQLSAPSTPARSLNFKPFLKRSKTVFPVVAFGQMGYHDWSAVEGEGREESWRTAFTKLKEGEASIPDEQLERIFDKVD